MRQRPVTPVETTSCVATQLARAKGVLQSPTKLFTSVVEAIAVRWKRAKLLLGATRLAAWLRLSVTFEA